MTSPNRGSPSYSLQASLSGDERERVVQALCVHFASDHIGMESLEQRLAMAYAAATPEQLQHAIADLPVIDDKVYAGSSPALAAVANVPKRGVALAVMGGVSRRGSWMIPRHFKVITIMGGAEIDLREARFGPGVTEIDCYTLMGGVEITVPPGVRVESLGGAFMGGFETTAGDAMADPSAPVLRVTGLAVMGGVEVKIRRPGKKMLARFQAALHAAGISQDTED